MVKPAVGAPTNQVKEATVYSWFGKKDTYFRVYHRDTYAPSAVAFRRFGPISRYDHHDGDKLGKPARARTKGTIYLSESIGVALAEVFGEDRPARICPSWYLAKVIVEAQSELRILDLTGPRVMHPGAFASILGLGRKQSQEWARSIYRLTGVDGIKYVGSHDYGTCVVLFERAARAGRPHAPLVQTEVESTGRINECTLVNPFAEWRAEINQAYSERKMVVEKIDSADCKICKNPDRRP